VLVGADVGGAVGAVVDVGAGDGDAAADAAVGDAGTLGAAAASAVLSAVAVAPPPEVLRSGPLNSCGVAETAQAVRDAANRQINNPDMVPDVVDNEVFSLLGGDYVGLWI
jgi:hypothetical protein